MSNKSFFTTKAMTIGAKLVIKLMQAVSEERWMKLVNPIIARQAMPEARIFLDIALRRLYRGFPTLSKSVKERFIQNLIVKSQTVYKPRRSSFYQENGYQVPSLMVLSPTMRCNLRCCGCYAFEYQKGDDLPYDVVTSVLTRRRRWGSSSSSSRGESPTRGRT